ncbi:MAG: nucleoside deaminase [Oscillospiraceae bacterium]|nr:nucleoside deaminase [Oscillospiraceae bacterium]
MNFMDEALKEAYDGINSGHGGPFGAVIVKDGRIVGRGHNCVVILNDPTCHGEIQAIRDACSKLNTFDLSGCEIYTTAEPCPMCLGAVMWANISNVYYGCSRMDTDSIGFRDNTFYDVMNGENSQFIMMQDSREKCLELFERYSNMKDRQNY